MDFHPAANLFPMMADAELAALEADMRVHGQREPIVVLDCKILDGRNRYRACQAIDIEPLLTKVTEQEIGGDPIAYAVSANMRRRHLNPSQLAMVGAEVEKLYAVEAEKRMLTGKPDPRATLPQGRAREQAAEMVGVGDRSFQKAKAVMEAGAESLSAAVAAGAASVSAAEKLVRAVPDKEQQAAIVAEALESTTPAREIRRKISGGTSFDVEEIENAPYDEPRKLRNGAPLVSTKSRTELRRLLGKLCRELHDVGLYERFIEPLSQIAECVNKL